MLLHQLLSRRALRILLAGLFTVAITLLLLLHQSTSSLHQEQVVSNSIFSSRHAFTRGGAQRALEYARATPPPEFEPTESQSGELLHSSNTDGAVGISHEMSSRRKESYEAENDHALHSGSMGVERPAPTHIELERSERTAVDLSSEAIQKRSENVSIEQEYPDYLADEERKNVVPLVVEEYEPLPVEGSKSSSGVDAPSLLPTLPPVTAPTLDPTPPPSPAPTLPPNPEDEYETALDELYDGKTWSTLHTLVASEPAPLTSAVDSEEYSQAANSVAAAMEQQLHALSSDGRAGKAAVEMFVGALRTGVTNETWGGEALLDSSSLHHGSTTSWWTQVFSALDDAPQLNFSFIELGCFSQESLLSAQVADRFDEASVLAIDVCGGRELGALLRIQEEQGLNNLLVSRASPAQPVTSSVVRAWKEVLVQEEMKCDYLAVTSLHDIGRGLLPFELEAAVADLFTLCSDTLMPGTLPDDRLFSYWSDALELIERSKFRVRTPPRYNVTATKLLSKSSSTERSSSSSSLSHYSSKYSTTTTTYLGTRLSSSSSSSSKFSSSAPRAWRVSAQPLTPSPAACLVPAWSPRFLLATGLVETHRFLLIRKLSAASGVLPIHTKHNAGEESGSRPAPLVVFGSSVVARATVVQAVRTAAAEAQQQAAADLENSDASEAVASAPTGSESESGTTGGASETDSVSLLPNRTSLVTDEEKSDALRAATTTSLLSSASSSSLSSSSSSRYHRTYSPYYHHRSLLGVLYDSPPTPEESPSVMEGAQEEEEEHGGGPHASKRGRVSDFLSSSAQRLQVVMMEQEEPPFFAVWEALRSELESTEFGSALCLGSEMGLLGLKVAQAHPRATVVSVRQERAHGDAHLTLLNLLKIRNNLPAASNLSLPFAGALLAPRDKFHVSVLGESVVAHAMRQTLDDKDSDGGECVEWAALEHLYGSLLTLARTSFVVLPRLSSLSAALRLMLPAQCAQSFAERYTPPPPPPWSAPWPSGVESYHSPEELFVARSLAAAGRRRARVRRLRTHTGSAAQQSRLVFLRVEGIEEEGAEGEEEGGGPGVNGVSVYTLLHCGVLPQVKAELFRLFLEMPLWRFSSLPALVPWRLRLSNREDGARLALLVGTQSAGGDYRGPGEREVAASVGGGGGSGGGSGEAGEHSMKAAWWQTLRRELERCPACHQNGRFTFLEYGSGDGVLSTAIAQRFPNATVLSVESEGALVDAHLDRVRTRGLWNNVLCQGDVDAALTKKFVESPELMRFQALSTNVLDLSSSSSSFLSSMLSTGLTSFVHVPTDAHMSLAMELFFSSAPSSSFSSSSSSSSSSSLLLGPLYTFDRATASARFSLASHPSRRGLADLDVAFLQHHTRGAATATTLSSERVRAPEGVAGLPLIRCDIVNMTRHVHHHFDYAKDGHTRTYTMSVVVNASATAAAAASLGAAPLDQASFREVLPTSPADDGTRFLVANAPPPLLSESFSSPPPLRQYAIPKGHHVSASGELVSVSMVRDKSTHVIPYNAIRAVTLIAVLRLGLVRELRERAYALFVKLPLFEDMAPWNIVFDGARLDYIDYDTRDKTFDAEVQKAYQILSVLMNYKRTVSDFDRCGSKVGNPYNFPFISECVKSSAFSGPCDDPAFPVACGDGHCRSDYITCLRSIVEGEEEEGTERSAAGGPPKEPIKAGGRVTWTFQS